MSPRKRKVLVLVEWGTATTTARFIGGALRGASDRFALVAGSLSEEGALQEVARAAGHETLGLGCESTLDRLRAVGTLARYLRTRQVDLVHAHEERCALLAACAARLAPGTRVVYHRHHSFALTVPWLLMDTWAGAAAARVLAVAEAQRTTIATQHPSWSPKLFTALNGTSFEDDPVASAREGERLRSELALPQGTPVLVHVARLNYAKGHPHLFAALAILRAEGLAAPLVLVGDGPDRSALEARVAELGLRGVHFVGNAARVQPWFCLADVALLPSVTEAAPLVVVEAMAAGKPLVASRIAGIPEMAVDGETAILVPPGDPPALAKAIATYLRDEPRRRRDGVAARREYEQRLTAARMMQRWESHYAAVLGMGAGLALVVPARDRESEVELLLRIDVDRRAERHLEGNREGPGKGALGSEIIRVDDVDRAVGQEVRSRAQAVERERRERRAKRARARHDHRPRRGFRGRHRHDRGCPRLVEPGDRAIDVRSRPQR